MSETKHAPGDAYALPLEAHHESVANSCDMAHEAINDILSTLEICAAKMETQAQVDTIRTWQATLRQSLDFLDTDLNESYSLSAKFSALIAKIQGEE